MNHQGYVYAVGRRKTAVARVRLMPGNGVLMVNGKPLEEAFPRLAHRAVTLYPLRATGTQDRFNAVVKVLGGGVSGQAGAIRLGISRALLKADETLKPILRREGLLTSDARVKERKKYGLKRARKAPQYTKR